MVEEKGSDGFALQDLSSPRDMDTSLIDRTPPTKQAAFWAFVRTYLSPLYTGLLTFIIAIAVFATSTLFSDSFGFFTGLTDLWPFALLAIALPLLVNRLIHGIKANRLLESPPCQTIGSTAEILVMIRRYPYGSALVQSLFAKALKAHIQDAMKLLNKNSPWGPALLQYGDAPGRDEGLITTHLKKLQQAKMILEDSQSNHAQRADAIAALKEVFEHLENLAEIDPSYRPATNWWKTLLAALAAIVSLGGAVWTLVATFTGGITSIAACMIPTVILGYIAWCLVRYIARNNASGIYLHWAAFSGVATVTFAVLGIFALNGFDIGLSPLTNHLALWLSLGTFLFFTALSIWYAWNANQYVEKRTTHREHFFYKFSKGLLLVFQISLMISCLILTALSIATSFGFPAINLGALGTLPDLQKMFITLLLAHFGGGSMETILPLLGVGTIVTFTIPLFIAFEMFKKIVERMPNKASSINNQSWLTRAANLAIWLFKGSFFTGMISMFYQAATSEAFSFGATTALFPIFFIIISVMPLAAGNVSLTVGNPKSYTSRFLRWFNTFFGSKPFVDNQSRERYLRKKDLVIVLVFALLLLVPLIPGTGIPTREGFFTLLISAITTLVFRRATIWYNENFNPKAQAQTYLEASHVVPTDMPELPNDIVAVQMYMDFFRRPLPGHVRIRFELYKKNPHSRSSGLISQQSFIVDWRSDAACYIATETGNIDPFCVSIETPLSSLQDKDANGIPLAVQRFKAVHNYIRNALKANADPHTFKISKPAAEPPAADHPANSADYQPYDVTNHNCAHIALDIAKRYAEEMKIATAQELATIAPPSTLPGKTFQQFANIFVAKNKQHRAATRNINAIEKLQYDIDRLHIKILKARAADNQPFLANLEQLSTAKQNQLEALKNSLAEEKKSEEKHVMGRTVVKEMPRSFSVLAPSDAGLIAEKKPSRILLLLQQGKWFALTVLFLTLLIVANAQLLSAGWYLYTPLAAIASFILIGVFKDAAKQWSLYNNKQRLEFGLKSTGLISVIIFTTLSASLPSVAFTTSVILPIVAITTLLVSYFFGKRDLFENPTETVWRLLAIKSTDFYSEKTTEIERIVHKYENSELGPLTNTERKLLLHFINTAIQAMENEILPNEENIDKLTIWADNQEAGASAVFKTDLDTLKNTRTRMKINASALVEPIEDGIDLSVSGILQRLKTCTMSADNNSASKKIVATLLAVIFIGFATTVAALLILQLGTAALTLTAAQFIGWVIGGFAVAIIMAKSIMETTRQRASSYQQLLEEKFPSITAERLIKGLVTFLALPALTMTVGIMAGFGSALFFSALGINVLWGIGQFSTSSWLQEKLSKKSVPSRRHALATKFAAATDTTAALSAPLLPSPASNLTPLDPANQGNFLGDLTQVSPVGSHRGIRLWDNTDLASTATQTPASSVAALAVEVEPISPAGFYNVHTANS
jgi:hypothetical protein